MSNVLSAGKFGVLLGNHKVIYVPLRASHSFHLSDSKALILLRYLSGEWGPADMRMAGTLSLAMATMHRLHTLGTRNCSKVRGGGTGVSDRRLVGVEGVCRTMVRL